MKNITFYILVIPFLFIACSDGNVKSFHQNYPVENNIETESSTQVDTIYMHTGFYNIVGEGKAVRMRKEKSEEIYSLSPVPFVSINDSRPLT